MHFVSTGETSIDLPTVPTLARSERGRNAQNREYAGLDRVRRIGFGVLGMQLVGLLIWSDVLYRRYSLSGDFTVYHQAWWLIGHGDLNPFESIGNGPGFPFWTNHGEFIMWPLALIGRAWPHAVTMLWIQDIATVGAEAVAFVWLCDFAAAGHARSRPNRMPELLVVVGLILLVANPWTYWALSYDFHFETVGILFVLLAARDLYRDPTGGRLWLWVGLGLACGDVVSTYLVGVGICGALAGRRWRWMGLLMAVAALIWTTLLTELGANLGSGLAYGYGYLVVGAGAAEPAHFGLTQLATGIARHPQHMASVLWDRRVNLYATVSAGGVVGILFPWAIITSLLVLAENGLYRYAGFIVPGFQEVLIFVLLPVGTVGVLAALARRHARWAVVATVVITFNALAWGAVWIPHTSSRWLRVSPAAAAVLSSVYRQIPQADEVVVSESVSGRFSGRRWIYAFTGPEVVPVYASTVWFVVASPTGTEPLPVTGPHTLIAELAGSLHADLVAHGAGVWVFRWIPPPRARTFTLPAAAPTIAGWTAVGSAGQASTVGSPVSWRAIANGRPGYVVAADYWQELPGHYQATAVLSSTVPVNVEVWNVTGQVMVGRRSIPPTNGSAAVTFPVDATYSYPYDLYSGWGPFRIVPTQSSPGNQLEIRVRTPGRGLVNVSSLELIAIGGSTG